MIREFITVILSFDLEKIFKEPTKNALLQFFRYGFVGGIATVGDWGALYLLEKIMNAFAAAAIGFLIGLIINFTLSKAFVFSAEKTGVNRMGEFTVYGIIGAIGLLITEAIMFVMTKKLGIYFMLSKIVATAVVFVWNFAARKTVLYKDRA